MRRREFITLLGGAAAAWPLAARAQQPSGCRRIGVLMQHRRDDARSSELVAAFLQGLAAIGLDRSAATSRSTIAGRTAMPTAFADYAAELVGARAGRHSRHWRLDRRRPLLQATRTVPIVFASVADPVGAGFVDEPGAAGRQRHRLHRFEYSISGKWLELLKEIAPRVTRAAVLRDPATAADRPVWRHPGSGAVARRGGEPDQPARRRRDRARRSPHSRAPRMAV